MLQPPDLPSKSNNAQLNIKTCFLGHSMQKLRFISGKKHWTIHFKLYLDCQSHGSILGTGRRSIASPKHPYPLQALAVSPQSTAKV